MECPYSADFEVVLESLPSVHVKYLFADRPRELNDVLRLAHIFCRSQCSIGNLMKCLYEVIWRSS
jgi:hypothetical protein